MAGNTTITSTELESVDHGHRLHKSQYLSYYTTEFNKYLNGHVDGVENVISADLENIAQVLENFI